MPDHMKLFAGLGFGAVAVELVNSLISTSGGERIAGVILVLIMAGVVWAATRGHEWAGWAFAVLTGIIVIITIGDAWAGAPGWMRFGEPYARSSTMEMILGVVGALLAVGATYVYFTNDERMSPNRS